MDKIKGYIDHFPKKKRTCVARLLYDLFVKDLYAFDKFFSYKQTRLTGN